MYDDSHCSLTNTIHCAVLWTAKLGMTNNADAHRLRESRCSEHVQNFITMPRTVIEMGLLKRSLRKQNVKRSLINIIRIVSMTPQP